eukprot:16998-Eustigmatos_ZCMA.PRE.1
MFHAAAHLYVSKVPGTLVDPVPLPYDVRGAAASFTRLSVCSTHTRIIDSPIYCLPIDKRLGSSYTSGYRGAIDGRGLCD